MPQRSRWALPGVLEPENTRCFLIEIPDDVLYIAAFKGALYDLCKPYAWGNDDAHSALTAANRMLLAYYGIQEVDCEGGSMQLRACESGCGIEYSTDGVTWTCIDLAGCIETIWDEKLAGAFDDGVLGQGVSQGGPQSPPIPGQCHTYHVRLEGRDQWRCPSPIREQDTVHILRSTGGWSDGSPAWYCPDGATYILGACIPAQRSHVAGDPLNPAAYHMEVIGKFGTTYFNPLDSLYTVPNGTALTDFTLQANDATLSDNVGSIEFDVEVCTGGYVHHFDFKTGQHGWVPFNTGGHDRALYVAGSGFTNNDFGWNGLVQILAPNVAANLYAIRITCSAQANGPTHTVTFYWGATTMGTAQTNVAGPYYISHAVAAGTGGSINFANDSASPGVAYTGYIEAVDVYGIGSDPF